MALIDEAKIKRAIRVLLIIIMLLTGSLPITVIAAENDAQGTGELAFLNAPGCRIGVSPGTIQEMLVNESYPNAQVFYMEKAGKA